VKISVVITTCNRPDFLKEALTGISKQVLAPYEVIIIDDCSTVSYDQVYPLIESLGANYLKQSENIGANAARNKGAQEATGNIVAFLDDDDIWLPEYLSEVHKEYLSGAEAIVTGFKQLGKEKVLVVNKDVQVTKHSLVRGNTYCGMSGFSCRRDILIANLFDESLSNGQDWDMYVRLFNSDINFRNIPSPLFLYRFQNEDGIGARVRKMKPSEIDKRLGSARKHKDFLGDYWFNKRVAEQLLFSLKHKKQKLAWVVESFRKAGVVATLMFFVNLAKRKLFKKPMSI
jgi:GalNAc5-diNAcBac-PP-undecaprenol beta-1,3-glucosyltransferase